MDTSVAQAVTRSCAKERRSCARTKVVYFTRPLLPFFKRSSANSRQTVYLRGVFAAFIKNTFSRPCHNILFKPPMYSTWWKGYLFIYMYSMYLPHWDTHASSSPSPPTAGFGVASQEFSWNRILSPLILLLLIYLTLSLTLSLFLESASLQANWPLVSILATLISIFACILPLPALRSCPGLRVFLKNSRLLDILSMLLFVLQPLLLSFSPLSTFHPVFWLFDRALVCGMSRYPAK